VALLSTGSLGVGVACASAPSGPRGVLTAQEYAELQTAQTQVVSAGRAGDWARVTRVCQRLDSATETLVSERHDCVAGATFFSSASLTGAAQKRCAAKGPDLSPELRCLLPFYRRSEAGIAGLYQADTELRALVIARGFGGRCADVLATTTRALTAEHRLVDDSQAMVRSMSEVNGLLLVTSARAWEKDFSALESADAGSQSLGRCPHV